MVCPRTSPRVGPEVASSARRRAGPSPARRPGRRRRRRRCLGGGSCSWREDRRAVREEVGGPHELLRVDRDPGVVCGGARGGIPIPIERGRARRVGGVASGIVPSISKRIWSSSNVSTLLSSSSSSESNRSSSLRSSLASPAKAPTRTPPPAIPPPPPPPPPTRRTRPTRLPRGTHRRSSSRAWRKRRGGVLVVVPAVVGRGRGRARRVHRGGAAPASARDAQARVRAR